MIEICQIAPIFPIYSGMSTKWLPSQINNVVVSKILELTHFYMKTMYWPPHTILSSNNYNWRVLTPPLSEALKKTSEINLNGIGGLRRLHLNQLYRRGATIHRPR